MSNGSERAVAHARTLLMEAAVDMSAWGPALQAVADACGARTGQLICQGPTQEIAFNLVTGIDGSFTRTALDHGFDDPDANPRLRAGLAAPVMTPLADQDYLHPERRRDAPIYGALFEPHGLWFNCQAVLLRQEDLLVRMSVTRTRSEGPLDDADFATFRKLMPAAHAAVRLRAALESMRVAGMIQSLDAVGSAALLLDGQGRVVQASRAGEQILARADVLTVRDRRLAAAAGGDPDATLEHQLAVALSTSRHGPMPLAPVFLPACNGMSGLSVELQPLPAECEMFGTGVALLVLMKPQHDDNALATTLRNRFCLTDAESNVVLRLAEGETPHTIARERGVALATVRSQVQAAYSKLRVRHQTGLTARLRMLREDCERQNV